MSDLRSLRTSLQNEEDAVSFVRRVAQGRLDVVHEEQRQRGTGGHAANEPQQMAAVFGQQQGGGSARPPRDTEIPADHARVADLTELCDRLHFGDYKELTDEELAVLESGLAAFEAAQSADRRALFAHIDALSSELVNRYKSGGASVDSLLG